MSTPINISASRGASILGLSKWKTPVQSWLEIMEALQPGFCEKHKYNLPEFEKNAALIWGTAFESAIIELAEKKQDDVIGYREKYFKKVIFCSSPRKKISGYDAITCHIDGQYAKNINILHEGKTTSYFYWHDNFGEPGTDKVPIEYQIQCQHQMICTDAKKVILSVLVFPKRVEEWEEMGWEVISPDNEFPVWKLYNEKFLKTGMSPINWAISLNEMGYFHQYEIKSHPELQKSMIQHYTEFWNENVLSEKEPIPQTYDDIKALCTEPVGTILTDNDYTCNDCHHKWRTIETYKNCPECQSEDIESRDTIANLMAEYKNIKSEIGGTGPLAKRANQIKVAVLDYMHNAGAIIDDESQDKWILRDQSGAKLASYGKYKNGVFGFR
jgi:predicted phage-related endonuclease